MFWRFKESHRHHNVDYRPQEVAEIKWIYGVENNRNNNHDHHPLSVFFFVVKVNGMCGRPKDDQLECLIKEIRPYRNHGNEQSNSRDL